MCTRDIPAALMWARDTPSAPAWPEHTLPALITAEVCWGCQQPWLSPVTPSATYLPPNRHLFTAGSQTFSQFKTVTKLHFTLENYLYCNLASFVVKTSLATVRTGFLGVSVACFCLLGKFLRIADENRGHWGGVISSTLPWQTCHQLRCLTWGAAS